MATISRPLTALTQKERKQFVRSSECDEAFKEIKHLLVTAPLLHPPISGIAKPGQARALPGHQTSLPHHQLLE